jgi:hypothetical protein
VSKKSILCKLEKMTAGGIDMAMKRCPICGEKFSDTYRDCPFCEEEDALRDGEEIRRHPRKGGSRVSHGRQFNIITPTLVVLILIMAALLVYLLYGDKLGEKFGDKKDKPGKAPVEDIIEEQPGEDPSQGTMPEDSTGTEDPVVLPLETDYDMTMKLPSGINLSTTDFSLRAAGESHTIRVTGGGNGTYSWVSEDDGIASVDENGKVVAVSNGTVNVVVTDGEKKGVCIVRVRASGTTQTQNPTTEDPASGTLKAGEAKVINAPNGVRVRSGPSTDHEVLATISNGAKVKVVKHAEGDWYNITFSGVGGATTSGYMKADYLQNT